MERQQAFDWTSVVTYLCLSSADFSHLAVKKTSSKLLPGVKRSALTLVETLVVIAILAGLIALSIPAIEHLRGAADDARCVSNLRQMGLAVGQYVDTKGRFPNALWAVDILPYIEQEALYKQYKSRDLNVIKEVVATIIPTYLCPADPRENAGGVFHSPALGGYDLAVTSYHGVAGKIASDQWDGPLGNPLGPRTSDITDGLSNTLIVGERPPTSDAQGWWSGPNHLWAINAWPWAPYWNSGGDFRPFEADPKGGRHCPDHAYFSGGNLDSFCHGNHFWSFHPGGGNWLFCDGAVRFMNYSAGTTLIPALSSIAGGEEVPSLD
jgi:prepilin-type processing-associated H-X9-DG protein